MFPPFILKCVCSIYSTDGQRPPHGVSNRSRLSGRVCRCARERPRRRRARTAGPRPRRRLCTTAASAGTRRWGFRRRRHSPPPSLFRNSGSSQQPSSRKQKTHFVSRKRDKVRNTLCGTTLDCPPLAGRGRSPPANTGRRYNARHTSLPTDTQRSVNMFTELPCLSTSARVTRILRACGRSQKPMVFEGFYCRVVFQQEAPR